MSSGAVGPWRRVNDVGSLVWLSLQGAAVLFGGPATGIGVAAQAERHRQRDVVCQGEAEGAQGGEAESHDLGDGDEVGVVAGAVGVDGLEGGHAGEADVAGADGEEHRCEKGDDEGHQDVSGAEGWCRFG